jgi:hypothetical protein
MSTALRRTMFLCACLALTAATALAQHGPGGGGMGGQHGGSMGGQPGMGFPNDHGGPPALGSHRSGTFSTMRNGLQLGPPGRWWDDKDFAKSLGLRKEQQKRMDSVFDANKGAILESYKALQKQESNLEATSREAKLDEGKIFAAIDGVNQARSCLEKANAHMLLMVRQEMDADQLARMEKFRDKPPVDE